MVDANTKQIVDKFEEENVKFNTIGYYIEKKSYPSDTIYYIVIVYGDTRIKTTFFKLFSNNQNLKKNIEELRLKKLKINNENNTDAKNSNRRVLVIDLKNIPVKNFFLYIFNLN